jgi:queuine tRNA-ribosyltransferase
LYTSRELLAYRLNSLHNLTYFLDVARRARAAVIAGKFSCLLHEMESLYDV